MPEHQVFHVYILRCADDTLYVGSTDNLQQRLEAHNRGTATRYTACRRPVRLLYSEPHRSQSSAVRRERQLKRWTRAKKEALTGGHTRDLRALSRSREGQPR